MIPAAILFAAFHPLSSLRYVLNSSFANWGIIVTLGVVDGGLPVTERAGRLAQGQMQGTRSFAAWCS